jgi:hypothetical protein
MLNINLKKSSKKNSLKKLAKMHVLDISYTGIIKLLILNLYIEII